MRAFVPAIDWLTGFRKLDKLYREHKFANLDAVVFAERLMALLEIKPENTNTLLDSVPARGPCLLLANHPLGAIEGVVLARVLSGLRPDVKILANRRLQVFSELSPWFIFTEPLTPGAQGNLSSLRRCHQHLSAGGLLVVFPAGRVSTQRAASSELQDYPWHRAIKTLLKIPGLVTLPVFIEGRNSPMFYRLGRLHPQLRMMTLMREMLKAKGRALSFHPAKPVIGIPPALSAAGRKEDSQVAALRLLTFLQNPSLQCASPLSGLPDPEREQSQLAPPIDSTYLAAEVAGLPARQCLVSAGAIDVFYCTMQQTPLVVAEIQRLRESVFRGLDEGSGQPRDGDAFDNTYTHLFLFERTQNCIVGACRLGRTDALLASGGIDSLYLNQMFNFKPGFLNMTRPCLEMGRSFVIPGLQRSYQALQLIFKGIGAFIGLYPQYQTLYGTVSISSQYSPLSTLLIREALVQATPRVSARRELAAAVPGEMRDYLQVSPPDMAQLDWLVRQLEADGKGIPVLLRHYARMHATFHAMGIDPNFAGTPGLLLSVDIAGISGRARQRFLPDTSI